MWHLTLMLLRDPESRLQAAIAEWEHPVSREWILMAETFDLAHAVASKRKPKPLPRPWPDGRKKIGGNNTVQRTAADVNAMLRPAAT